VEAMSSVRDSKHYSRTVLNLKIAGLSKFEVGVVKERSRQWMAGFGGGRDT
jgi:hypothetical protein